MRTRERSGTARKIVGPSLATVVVVAGMVFLFTRPPMFTRYVSPPLADGMRLTFLRPFSLNEADPILLPDSKAIFTCRRADTVGDKILRFASRWRASLRPDRDQIHLRVASDLGIFERQFGTPASVTRANGVKVTRYSDGLAQGHVEIVDARHKRLLAVLYQATWSHSDNEVRAIVETVRDSLRILKKGEQVPPP